jgi:hypothetical protein
LLTPLSRLVCGTGLAESRGGATYAFRQGDGAGPGVHKRRNQVKIGMKDSHNG